MPRNQIDWEAIEKEYPGLCCLHLGNGESAVIELLKNILRCDRLAEIWGLPDILWFEFEFPLPRGRIDLILFHADGTISIVEAKDALNDRQIVAGIGQLCMYAVQVGHSKPNNGIRKILTVPIAGKNKSSLLIDNACRNAGVIFEPLGTIKEHQEKNNEFVLGLILNDDPQ